MLALDYGPAGRAYHAQDAQATPLDAGVGPYRQRAAATYGCQEGPLGSDSSRRIRVIEQTGQLQYGPVSGAHLHRKGSLPHRWDHNLGLEPFGYVVESVQSL